MPNRIIKESICTSDSIDQLGWFDEVLFYRLIVNCDDFGRFDGRAIIIKNRLFPLKDSVTLKNVEASINRLVTVGLVNLYDVDGRPFLQLPTWDKHQRIRNHKSKYPSPDDGNPLSIDSNSPTIVPVIQSNPNPNPNPNPVVCPETSSEPVITLPLNDNSEYPIYPEQTEEWAGLYPAVDVIQQLRNMKGWLNANPSRRKTKSGILRFITIWLAKEQNSGKSCVKSSPALDTPRMSSDQIRKMMEKL